MSALIFSVNSELNDGREVSAAQFREIERLSFLNDLAMISPPDTDMIQ